MFRTKKDVDRHVQDIFRKLKDENERNLRCYNIAKLYYQVGDYESAKRYVSTYLEVRDNSAGAHKLLGQAYEALGQKEAALGQYRISLELDARQDDLVLKVCEQLADTDVSMDVNRVRYWVERADKLFPHHPIVFQLKEKMLAVEKPDDSNEDLEALIASELSARPTDVHLRVKLLKHYMSKQKFDDAYNHATNVEATHSHRNSIVWYQALTELLGKCKESKISDWSFWVLYISSLERYAALSLKEQGNDVKKTLPEATQAVFHLDQSLAELKSKNFSSNATFTEHMLSHMWGQLHFHLACLLLRKTKREQGSWNEAGRLCAPLLLTALHVRPMDPSAAWAIHLKDRLKSQIRLWYREGSYRCSQAGHVLQDYGRDDVKKLMDKIDKFCTGPWRERIFQRIFVSRVFHQFVGSSHFATHTTPNPPLRLCSQSELEKYDEVAEEVWPDSLHHQIWLGIKHRRRNLKNKDTGPHPNQTSHIFSELQFSVYNLNQAAPDSLSRLDIDAFLNAAIFCASAVVEEQQLSGFLNPERLPTLPADLTMTLCTSAQEKWWTSAYKMYSKQETLDGEIGEIRQELQRGLEVVRCIGSHGLHPALIVHLARIFQYRAKLLRETDKEHGDLPALEARYETYWSTVIPLLERLQNNQTIRLSNSKLFSYQGKEMNNAELTNALEEGKLLLAQRFVRDKQYDQAVDALQALKCPEASFQQGKIYKILADEIVNTMSGESLTSEMRSQHVIMLSKARNCFYLTLDRLRSAGANPKHALNSELCMYITHIENELKRIDPDLQQGDFSRNECDGMSDESYSSAHSGEDQPVTNASLLTLSGLNTSGNMLNTPQRNNQRTPKQSSTPCRHSVQQQDILDLSRNRAEARPSLERLDAQIRQIVHSRDNAMQPLIDQNKAALEQNKVVAEQNKAVLEQNKVVLEQNKVFQEQNKALLDSSKATADKVEELVKEMAELRKELQRLRTQSVNMNPNLDENLYVLGEQDYGDLNYNAAQGAQASSMSGNMFPSTHRHPYAPFVYPSATTFQGYYQGAIPFNDPNAQSIHSLYPSNLYSMPVLYPNRQKMPENILQQALFPSRLPTQLPDLMPTANQPLQVPQPMQKAEVSKPETKDAPVKKVLPVNIVITTSDTLPTTAPVVQPTLSVTIPPHHRLGTTSTAVTTDQSNAPHCYQISMPSQANIPTTVNLPPLTTMTSTTSNILKPRTPKPADQSSENAQSPNSSYVAEVEHDPMPDYVPVIPLPAEVAVTTGEEDEITLYSANAKLFRFVDKEWKERGVGTVKLLKNKEGKVRLLMRRDQVLKICANHMLTPEMELTPIQNNERAWMWVANDFADEKVQLEKLCIKFNCAEEARSFKEHFDKAKANLGVSPQKAKTTEKPVKVDTTEQVKEQMKPDQPAAKTTTHKSVEATKPSENFSITITRVPPAAVTNEICIQADLSSTPTENETILFNEKASLQYFNSSANHWENKGSGVLKVLLHTKSGKLRILMIEDNSSKVCYNYKLHSNMVFAFKQGSSTTITWNIHGKADDKTGIFGATFKQSVETFQFYTTIINHQMKMIGDSVPVFSTAKKAEPAVEPVPVSTANQTPSNHLSLQQKFKPPAGSWTCNTCLIVNDSSADSCAACCTPKVPGESKPKDKKEQPTFTFGNVAAATTTKKATSGLQLSNIATEKAEPQKLFGTIGSEASKPDASGMKMVFGIPQKTGTVASAGTPFTFGSPGKTHGFHFVSKSPAKSTGASENSEEESEVESDDIHFSPVIPMPDEIDVKTGEEDEEVLYVQRAKLFRFDSSVKEWKERGLGDIKLLKHNETGKVRLIMRRDRVLKLCLNHIVLPELEMKAKDEKTWQWNAGDYSEGKVEYMLFACRFKTPDIANEFKKAIDENKNARPAAVGKTVPKVVPKATPSAEVKTEAKKEVRVKTSPTQDIEVVYEAQVTPEERTAALKLKLPSNFYAYKQKPDCPGCRGCKDNDTTIEKSTPKLKARPETEKPPATILTSVTSSTSVPFSAPAAKHFTEVKPSLDLKYTTASTIAATTGSSMNSIFTSGFTTSTATGQSKPSGFDLSTMSFGTSEFSTFGEKKAGFSFGMPTSQASSTDSQTSDKLNIFQLENAKICEPSSAADPNRKNTGQSIFSGQKFPVFNNPNLTIFDGSGNKQENNIFNSDTTGKNIFGGTTAKKNDSSILKPSSFSVSTTNTTTSSSNSFGVQAKTTAGTVTNETTTEKTTASSFGSFSNASIFDQASTSANTVFGSSTFPPSTTTTSIFDMTQKPSSMMFNGSSSTFSPKLPFDTTLNTHSPFGKTNTPTNNVFETNPTEAKKEESTVSFLAPANLTFSTLAANAPQREAFKKDPNFSFDGAGSCVFGSKNAANSSLQEKKHPAKKDEKEEDAEENENDEEHDPQFEPIIPLPDAIEVRTGEEDEEKVFCERAKLYRYDPATREWKERGVGEMKILHHVARGTYRLLLRREQVHKVVCNLLLTPDMDFLKLSTSDRAWVWAGMNYAEENPCVEELSVKFKNTELAARFKAAIDKILETLRENRKKVEGDNPVVEDLEDADEEEEEQDEEEEENGEEASNVSFERRATLYVKSTNDSKWELLTLGTLSMCYDPDVFSYRRILMADESDKIVSDTVIDENASIQLAEKECIWTAVDCALKPPVKRTLKAVFSSNQAAKQMFVHFAHVLNREEYVYEE